MIVDLRTYTTFPGKHAAYLKIHQAEALPILRKYVGEPIGYLASEIGPLNQLVHIWGYDNLSQRTERRAAMAADAEWIEYQRKMGELGYRQHQENKILRTVL